MKKLLLSIAFGLPIIASAQILNAGFESARPDNNPANWGKIIFQPVPCSSALGYDSVYFLVKEPHTGVYALEMRNASCDNSSFFAGGAILMENDTNYFSLGAPFSNRPTEVSFFYKLFQTGGDIGNIAIQLIDDVSNITVADAQYDITQPTSQYTAISVPLTYYDAATPTRIEIIFSIVNPTDHVHYGTRFLVDDVSTLTTGLTTTAAIGVSVFPNPTQGSITIKTKETQPLQLMVYNALGQEVMNDKVMANTTVDVQHLRPGAYYYRVVSNTKPIAAGKLLRE